MHEIKWGFEKGEETFWKKGKGRGASKDIEIKGVIIVVF